MDVLLPFIVEFGVVDTRRASNEEINVSGDGRERTVSGSAAAYMRILLGTVRQNCSRFVFSELTNVAEKE